MGVRVLIWEDFLGTLTLLLGEVKVPQTAAAPAHISVRGTVIKDKSPFNHKIKAQGHNSQNGPTDQLHLLRVCMRVFLQDKSCLSVCLCVHLDTHFHTCHMHDAVCFVFGAEVPAAFMLYMRNILYISGGIIYAPPRVLRGCRLQMWWGHGS